MICKKKKKRLCHVWKALRPIDMCDTSETAKQTCQPFVKDVFFTILEHLQSSQDEAWYACDTIFRKEPVLEEVAKIQYGLFFQQPYVISLPKMDMASHLVLSAKSVTEKKYFLGLERSFFMINPRFL